jgi:hypothetical protein
MAWTGHTPPPGAGPTGAGLRLDEEAATGERARRALVAAVVLQALGQVGSFLVFRDAVDSIRAAVDSGGTAAAHVRFSPLTQVGSVGSLVGGIFFLIWFHRAARNAVALGLPARREPGMATASFVIPIVNLWWPYQSTCDLLPAGHGARPLVLRWWLLWVVGGVVSTVAVMVAAAVGGPGAWAVLALPAVQLTAAGMAARRVVAEVVAAHRQMEGLLRGR